MKILKENEFYNLKNLINITRMLDDLYSKLNNLILNNQNKTLEYQKYFNYLQMVLEMEKEQYTKLNLDYDLIYRYLQFINKTYKLDNNTNLEINDDKIIIKRIWFKIWRFIANKKDFLNYCNHEDIKNSLLNITKNNQLLNDDNLDIEEVINNKFNYMYITILYKSYLNKENSFCQKELLKKYANIIFANPYLEDRIINNRNDMELSAEENIILQDKVYDLSLIILNNILKVTDVSYSYHKTMVDVTLLKCMFNTCLTILNIENRNKVKDIYLKIINSKEYQKQFLEDKISNSIIINCFNNMNQDIDKPLSV